MNKLFFKFFGVFYQRHSLWPSLRQNRLRAHNTVHIIAEATYAELPYRSANSSNWKIKMAAIPKHYKTKSKNPNWHHSLAFKQIGNPMRDCLSEQQDFAIPIRDTVNTRTLWKLADSSTPTISIKNGGTLKSFVGEKRLRKTFLFYESCFPLAYPYAGSAINFFFFTLRSAYLHWSKSPYWSFRNWKTRAQAQ